MIVSILAVSQHHAATKTSSYNGGSGKQNSSSQFFQVFKDPWSIILGAGIRPECEQRR